MSAEAFPLQWPMSQARTPPMSRKRAQFKTTFAGARDGLLHELQLLGARPGTLVISSNIPVRVDGLPYANCRPADGEPGVAVYFSDRKGRPMCIACDRWTTADANLQAVRLTIEALRGLERWGTSHMVEAAFSGFQAIADRRPWWEVLGVNAHAPTDQVHERFNDLARQHHPDRGGDTKKFQDVAEAYATFRKERGLA